MADLLIERWQHCTVCGGAPIIYAHIWKPLTPDGPVLALAVAVCAPCRGQGEVLYLARLAVTFKRRYQKERYGDTKTDE